MLIAFSIFSILIGCGIVFLLRIRGTRLAYIWLFLFVLIALLLFLIVLVDPANIEPFTVGEFFRTENDVIAITFRMTNSNRIVGIGVFVLVLAFLATETASPQGDQSLKRWIEVLVFCSAIWAALLSDNAWTILISWTILDLINIISELVFKNFQAQQFLNFYLSKFIGSMVLVSVISRAYQANPQNLLGGQIPYMGMWVLLAVFLHAGIFHQLQTSAGPQKQDKYKQLIQGLYFFPHFYLLTQVPNIGTPPLQRMILQVLMFTGALIMAIIWFIRKDDQLDFHQLIIALAFTGAFLFLSENQQGLIYFLITLLPMSWVFLAHERSIQLTPLWIVGMLILSGFPFTLQYALFENLILGNRILSSGLMAIPTTLIMVRVFRFLRKPGGNINRLEKINQAIYLFGLAIPIIGIILVLWTYRPAIDPDNFWFGAVHVFLFFGFNYVADRRKNFQVSVLNKNEGVVRFMEIRQRLVEISKGALELAGAGLTYGARLLEEEGGILWAIVFLSLLLTILASMRGIN